MPRKGGPSIPPDGLLVANVLMALYSIRSERQFCEQLQYDMLFRWFLDLNPDETTFNHSTFSQNQSRLLKHKVWTNAMADLAMAMGWADFKGEKCRNDTHSSTTDPEPGSCN